MDILEQALGAGGLKPNLTNARGDSLVSWLWFFYLLLLGSGGVCLTRAERCVTAGREWVWGCFEMFGIDRWMDWREGGVTKGPGVYAGQGERRWMVMEGDAQLL